MILPHELVIDNFAGGGGASLGIEMALGRPIDVAINHDAEAVALHRLNHPHTLHLCQSVWKADPRDVVVQASARRRAALGLPPGQPLRVGLAWFSPDCKHFSKAKGSAPVERHIRDLAWVVVHWTKLVRPRIVMLENVEEWQDWGPLIATVDGKLVPCPKSKGVTFRRWWREMERLGGRGEMRELRAADFDTPTTRNRLFVIFRFDGEPIEWPVPTRAKNGAGGLPAWRSAAECIDWSIPCPSIFDRKRPLVEATMARIGRGVWRYVIDAARPFIVPVTHQGDERVHSIDDPLRTITTAQRGEHALVAPYLVAYYGKGEGGQPRIAPVDEPARRVTTENRHALVAAFLAQHNGGMVSHAATELLSTITGRGTQQAIVAAMLSHAYSSNTCGGNGDPRAPMKTITTGGHHALVQAFLVKYYGSALGQRLDEPLHTATAKPRFGLVTVAGVDYRIVDIGMRMLTPRELYRAQGFPDSYRIDGPGPDGTPLTKTAQIRMCGNSVCPPVAAALVRANTVMPARQGAVA